MRVRQSAILKKLLGNDKGFTLLELLIVIALTGIISAAAAMSIHQVFTSTALSNDQNTAINQVRNAVHWIGRDGQMAKTVNDSPEPPKFLELTWESWNGSQSHNVTYELLDSPDGLKVLQRNYDGQQLLIAQYIKPEGAGTDCHWNEVERVLSVNITAAVGDKTETSALQIKARPD